MTARKRWNRQTWRRWIVQDKATGEPIRILGFELFKARRDARIAIGHTENPKLYRPESVMLGRKR